MTERTGGCACGAIRFKITAPFAAVGVCHCKGCQKASGGAPNYAALVPSAAFEVTKGKAKTYISKADSGNDAMRSFCPDCGTPLWSGSKTMGPMMAIKLGALDDNSDIMPELHLFTESAPTWHLMHEGLPTFPKMPPMPAPEA